MSHLPYSLLTGRPSSGGIPTVDLSTITNLVSYYDASVGISKTGGDLITDWADQVDGSTNDFAQGTDANRLIHIASGALNGAPCVRLQDTARWMTDSSFVGMNAGEFVEIWAVMKPHGTLLNARYIVVSHPDMWITVATGASDTLKVARFRDDADVLHNLGESIDASGGGLIECRNNGTNVSGSFGGTLLDNSPIVTVEGINANWTNLSVGRPSNNAALMDVYYLAVFSRATAGEIVSAADRATILAVWNYYTGLSMT